MPERWPFGGRHEAERLSALLDDELPEAEALEVTRHVAGCERCLHELELIREARRALRSLPDVAPPDDLYRSILARRPGAAGGGSVGLRIGAAALASLGLLTVAAFAVGGDEPGTVAPPVDVYVADHVVRMEGGPVLRPVDLGR